MNIIDALFATHSLKGWQILVGLIAGLVGGGIIQLITGKF